MSRSQLDILAVGDANLERRELDEAERAYREALDVDSRSVAALCGLGAVHSHRHEWPAALLWGRRALSVDSESIRARALVGVGLLSVGSVKEAIPHLSVAADLGGDRAVRAALADAYDRLDRSEEAESELKRALESPVSGDALALNLDVPRECDLHYALSRIAAEDGRHVESAEHFDRGKQLDPNVHLGSWYGVIDSIFEAVPDDADPANADLSERDTALVRELLTIDMFDALQIATADPRLRGLEITIADFALSAQRTGHFVLSARLRVIGDCVIGGGSATLHELVHSEVGRTILGLAEAVHADGTQLATAHQRAGVVDIPAEHRQPLANLVERFARLDPESGAALVEVAARALATYGLGGRCHYVLADARYRVGDLGGARTAVLRAIVALRDDGDVAGQLDALARLAAIDSAVGHPTAAISTLTKLIEAADENDESGRSGIARLNRALDRLQVGDMAGATADARQLAEALISDESLCDCIGKQVVGSLVALLEHLGTVRDDDGLEALVSDLEALVDSTDPLLDDAAEKLQQGRANEAIALLQPVVDSGLAAAPARVTLGRAYAAAGDLDEADELLQQALNQQRMGEAGSIDAWPILMALADVGSAAGDREREIVFLSEALDVACARRDERRERATIDALSRCFLESDPARALAIAGRLFGGLDPSSPIVELARACEAEWSAKRYPSRQLSDMRQLLGDAPLDGRWIKQALVVAAAEVEYGSRRGRTTAQRVLDLVAAGPWGDLTDEMHARAIVARSHRLDGSYEAARDGYERAARIAEEVFDIRTEADIRGRLAIVLRHLDRPDLAVLQYRRALRIAERLDTTEQWTETASNMVFSMLLVGRHAEALALASEAIATSQRCGRTDLARYVALLLAHHVTVNDVPVDLKAALQELPATVDSESCTFPWLYESLHQAATLNAEGEEERALQSLRVTVDVAAQGNTSIRIAAPLGAARTLAASHPEAAWTFASEACAVAEQSGAHGLVVAECRELLLQLALETDRRDAVDDLVDALLKDWARLRQLLPEDADRIAVADRAVAVLHRAVAHWLDVDPTRALAVWDAARAPALADSISAISPEPGGRVSHLMAMGVIGDQVVALVDAPDDAEPVVVRTGVTVSDLSHILHTFRREMHVFQGNGSLTWTRLASRLLAGAAAHLPANGTVVVVADGAFQELPLHAVPLPDGQPLIARCAVVYAPSHAVLAALRTRAASTQRGRSIVTVGVAFPAEARALHARLGGTCWAADRLSKAEVRDSIRTAHVVHFACHGRFDPAIPINSGLELTTSPHPTADDILSIRDLETWRLRAGLVTLSACDSALGRTSPSEQLGLARSFLQVGAHSVLAAVWKIDDAATQQFMLDFYDVLGVATDVPQFDTAQALKTTQLRHASKLPLHRWAGFKLIGLPTISWQDPTHD